MEIIQVIIIQGSERKCGEKSEIKRGHEPDIRLIR